MLPDRVSNPGPLTYESGALQFALRGPAVLMRGRNIFLKKVRVGLWGRDLKIYSELNL